MASKENSVLLRNKIVFTSLSSVSLLCGLFIQFYFSNHFHGKELDLFYLGVSFCSVIISMSSGGVSGYLIAAYSQESIKVSLKNTIILFFVIFSLLGAFVFFALVFISTFLIHIDMSTSFPVSFFFLIYLLSLALNIVFQAYSYCHENYSGALCYEVYCVISYILCVFVIVSCKDNFLISCAVFCFRGYIQLIIYAFFSRKHIFYGVVSVREIKSLFADIKLLMGGSAYYKSEPVIDRLFLVANANGIAAYHLVSQIYLAISGLWFKIQVSPAVKSLSRARGNIPDFLMLFNKSIAIQMVVIFISAYILFFSPALNYFSTFSIFSALVNSRNIIYLLYVFFAASLLGQVVSNAYYAIGAPRIPIIVSCVTFTIFIPLKYFTIEKYGVNGLCVLVSSYHFINAIVLWVILRVRLRGG